MKFVATILNSTEEPGHVFLTSFSPRDFFQMASNKPFLKLPLWFLAALEPRHFEPNMLQTPK